MEKGVEHRGIILAIVLAAGWWSGCPSYTLLPDKDQRAVQEGCRGKVFFLKHSHFAGPFFEYPDRRYMSERAFDERVLIETLSGESILASGPTEVLPMGTRLRIREIEFPTSGAISARKLRSPRHFTWVMMDRAGQPGSKPYVLVLTHEFKNKKKFEEVLGWYLVEKDPRAGFADRPPEVISAIDTKTLVKGMRYDALIRSRGNPDKVDKKKVGGARVERWRYAPGRVVFLKDDVVERWEGFDF